MADTTSGGDMMTGASAKAGESAGQECPGCGLPRTQENFDAGLFRPDTARQNGYKIICLQCYTDKYSPTSAEVAGTALVPVAQELIAPEFDVQYWLANLGKSMNQSQANSAIARFSHCENMKRYLLLAMYEGGAHTALGYSTWAEFLQERLEYSFSRKYLYALLTTAQVERNLQIGPLFDSEPDSLSTGARGLLRSGSKGGKRPMPTYNQLMCLSTLATPKQQRQAWGEYETIREDGFRKPEQLEKALTIIVKRIGSRAGTSDPIGAKVLLPEVLANEETADLSASALPTLPETVPAPLSHSAPAASPTQHASQTGLVRSIPMQSASDDEGTKDWDFAEMKEALTLLITCLQNENGTPLDKPTKIWFERVLTDVMNWLMAE